MRPFKDGKGYSPKTALYKHYCGWCAAQFEGSMDKVYCSDPCRVNAWRANKKSSTAISEPVGWFKRRFAVFERDGFKCRYCGRSADEGVVLETDHILPRAAGGKDGMENLVTACRECNKGKGDRLLEDYKAVFEKKVGIVS